MKSGSGYEINAKQSDCIDPNIVSDWSNGSNGWSTETQDNRKSIGRMYIDKNNDVFIDGTNLGNLRDRKSITRNLTRHIVKKVLKE